MVDIICRITSDVEKSIRAHFSKNVAKLDAIPHDLATFLANDDIEIAYPILKDSGILKEADLIKVVKTRSRQHQLAVAARGDIGEAVCRVLCDLGDEEVCLELLNNHSAAIPLETLEILSNRSKTVEAYQKPLLQRPFLPVEIAEKMYRWVSMALRQMISEKFDINPNVLSIDPEDREKTIRSISSDDDPSEKLIQKLQDANELTIGFLVKSLRQGEVDLFELGFCRLIDVTRLQLQGLLYGQDPKRLAIACRGLDLDKQVFDTIISLIMESHDPCFSLTSEEKKDLIAFYGLLKKDAVIRALHNEDFLNGKISYSET
nr:DUF2336 domain-containing protein [Sneathiella limimaris]